MLDKEATRRPLERCSLHLESFASKTAFAATLQINTNTLMITFAKCRGRRQRDCGAQHLYGRRKGFSSGVGQGGTPLGLDIALTDARPQSSPQSWSPDAQQVRSVHMGDKGRVEGGTPHCHHGQPWPHEIKGTTAGFCPWLWKVMDIPGNPYSVLTLKQLPCESLWVDTQAL